MLVLAQCLAFVGQEINNRQGAAPAANVLYSDGRLARHENDSSTLDSAVFLKTSTFLFLNNFVEN